MDLKLYIRQRKTYDNTGTEVYYTGTNPFNLTSVQGVLPSVRQLPNYHNWIDVTDYISDIHKLSLEWTLQRDSAGSLVPNAQDQKKTATGTITFEGLGYKYLKQWLIDDVSAFNNQMEVRIDHVGCGSYTDWVINATDLEWCEDNVCTFDVVMRQADDAYQCIRNTLITDNHQQWFPTDSRTPGNGKKHPRFSYCVETRPNTLLVMIWWLMSQNMIVFIIVGFIIGTIVNSLIAILISILSLFAIFSQKVRDMIQDLENKMIKWQDIKDIIANFFVESAGCGREHPAPLIRDYIKNVCDKCGVTVDSSTAPIFFATSLDIETSADRFAQRGAQNRWNPHYYACYLGAVVQKGVRRYDSLSLLAGAVKNLTDWWHPENAPLHTLDKFLDELKLLYNANWRLVNNTLYFQRKDYWQDENLVFDFSVNAPDRALLVKGLCYEWNEVKYPAFIEGLYTPDAADVCGNAALKHYDGIVSTGDISKNPNIDGNQQKRTPIGATKFRLDCADNDYILDAYQQVVNASYLNGFLWVPTMFDTVFQYFAQYGDYALLLKQETTTLPKVIIWDGGSYDNAKAFRPYSVVSGVTGSGNTPPINQPYNNYPFAQSWVQKYPPHDKVLGNKTPPGNGVYTVARGPWGGNRTYPGWLCNYPMYFAEGFEGSMWDWFHWIDDPRFTPTLHKTVTAYLDMCCDTLKTLKVFNNGKDVVLGQKVRTPGVLGEGFINNIKLNYDTALEDGAHIELKINI